MGSRPFVDLKASTVKDEKLAALYTFNARCGAAVLLCVVVAVSWYLARNGHPWAAIAVVVMIAIMTVGQLLNHRADR
ncbi:MAG TPA: hypothetical protein VK638_40975 [Edaphobacter sp.]|nr:hypothetical protein [Edaphobacter sp.]